MIYLTSILKSIEVYCASTVTTNQLDFTLSYTEKVNGIYVPKTITGTTNGTSAVTMLASSPVNNSIEIIGISVVNNDSASNTITIRLNKTQGGTTILKQVLLDVGEQLEYSGSSWQTMTSTGEIKTGAGGGGGGGTWGSITGTLSAQTDLQTALDGKVDENAAITGATKTKITYDSKGLITAGADATTADIAASTDKNYVTDAQLVVIGNTSGTNMGDNAVNTLYSGLAASKQDTLVSGTNIKTINSNSLLGSGDLVIMGGDENDDFMLIASFKSLYNY